MSAPKSGQKTAVIFCCIPSHEINNHLITTLRRHGYHVSLLITCPLAFNYAMDPKGIQDMGRTIGDIVEKVWDPPAILSVVNTKQCEDIYCNLNPDFALSFYFAYPISAKMLSMKAKVVNMHPGRMPIERGPFPALWPTLYPEKYSMDDLCATFHYMNEKVDCGPIIKEIPLKDHYPEATTLANRPMGLLDIAIPAFFAHLDEVIELAEQGYEGIPQKQPDILPQSAEGTTFGARRPTDEERTIQSSWSRDEVLKHFRAMGESDGMASPLFWWKGRRYWVERMEEWEWPGPAGAKAGDVKRVGFDLIVMFEGGAVRMAARTR